MSTTSSWDEVQSRAQHETDFGEVKIRARAHHIEAFYPQLYEGGTPRFANTLGSDLLPDILTSATKVLVDLYDWPDEEGLIRAYGVDLEFLHRLRALDRIVLCANLPLKRYEHSGWLHETLADERTIWRSIRTAAFLTAIDPGYGDRQRLREEQLLCYFSAHSRDLPQLCSLADPAHPVQTAAALAHVLSRWIERINSLEPELAAPIAHDFEKHALERIPELKRLHTLAVSPYSAALGGTMRMWRHKWSSMFGDESVVGLSREGVLRSSALLSYLGETKLGLTSSDLKAEHTWRSMSEATRLRLLDIVSDDRQRADLVASEESIRTALASVDSPEPTRGDIRAYLSQAEGFVDRLEGIWDGAQIALPVAFGAVSNGWLLAAEVGAGMFCSKQLFGHRAQTLVENLVGRVQIVRSLRRK